MVNSTEQCNEESPLGYATYEVPSCKSISDQIGNFDKEEFPKKKILEDEVNYDKISPYASIVFPQRLKKQRDENESSKFLEIIECLREDESLYDVEVEERDWFDVEEGVLVDLLELLVEDTPKKNGANFEVE
jgi:hypothetical protein